MFNSFVSLWPPLGGGAADSAVYSWRSLIVQAACLKNEDCINALHA
jgi:hypothetical protein